MKWTLTCVMEFPVITVVEADTEEEAMAIAMKRLPVAGPDEDENVGWILDERFFNPGGSSASN